LMAVVSQSSIGVSLISCPPSDDKGV
jgi:hypothetical protein